MPKTKSKPLPQGKSAPTVSQAESDQRFTALQERLWLHCTQLKVVTYAVDNAPDNGAASDVVAAAGWVLHRLTEEIYAAIDELEAWRMKRGIGMEREAQS